MSNLMRCIFLAAAAIPISFRAARAAEPWADPHLPVKEGLQFWLDASRVSAAYEANGTASPRDGGGVAAWYDASGHKRDARQDAPVRRPVLRGDLAKPQATVVQFDGRDDGLLADVSGLELRDFTMFVVAAPFSNHGMFRAFLGANERGRNDYTTGFNVDLGGGGSGEWGRVNAEGKGFGGEKDLLGGAAFPFGTFHTLALTASGRSVRLSADGSARGDRPRDDQPLRPDELRIGFRFANPDKDHDGEIGFLDGCIAEVLLFDRALSDAERASVEDYLRRKHAPLLALKGVPPRPPVQMLVPGFTVRELPVKLPNLTNVRYGPDGRLYATGYDGRLHVMTDTDGDGLEDKAEVLWDKPTFRTPMAFGWAPGNDRDFYVVANGKISVLRDTDRDGKPDREDVFNTGWPPDAGFTGGGVDALGLAFDPEGNLYFGLGCMLFANPYLVDDKTGISRYDLRSERGTILKVSPDGKKREILCTGIRFPVGLAFNRLGDLFCTDQEGATWLPGGNPLDELNHIVPGRHYGFPYRHEKYLPNVSDEPPAVAFGPQHQSTCGLIFNEPTPERAATFGPKSWRGDAIVCGFSRGKIWRVPLVKTKYGYTGQQHLIAALRVLTLDSAIDPKGNLTIACHSGEPDWGTGPGGPGRLFKISYSDAAAPQPVLAWAQSPVEVHVAFDRPVQANVLGDPSGVRITYGEFVRAGDRFEVLKPPYAVVDQQSRAYRGVLRVISSRLSDDRRTLVLTTDPHPLQAWYAASIPLAGASPADGQERVVELDYDLTGVEASWTPEGLETPAWTGWLPDLNLQVSQALTAGSAEHEKLFSQMRQPGTLELITDVRGQPDGNVDVTLSGNNPLSLHDGPDKVSIVAMTHGDVAGTTLKAQGGKPLPLHLGVATRKLDLKEAEAKLPFLLALYKGPHDAERHLLPRQWQCPAWTPRALPEAPPRDAPSQLAGGDWKRGEALFFGAEANCATCHTLRGKGGHVGPDLSNLPHRDLASIYRDITEPNAVINPDHRGYVAVLKSGQVLAGLVRSDREDRLRIFDTAGKETIVPRADVKQLRADAISIMPEGYAKLGQEKIKDLLAFLTIEDPTKSQQSRQAQANPPAQQENKAPPPRTRAEVNAVLAKSEKADPEKLHTRRVLLVAGPKDHGPGEHDYPRWLKEWEPLLKKSPKLEVSTAFGPPNAKQWEAADLVVFYNWGPQFWNDDTYRSFDALMNRGGGFVALHSAVIPEKDPQKLADRIGLAYPTLIKFRHGPLDLKFTAAARPHPITRGFPDSLHLVDESYWPHVGDAAKTAVLATQAEEGQDRPMAWTIEHGKGRVFATILGHYTWTFDDPVARELILRGMAWAAGDPTGRFDALATEGVKFAD